MFIFKCAIFVCCVIFLVYSDTPMMHRRWTKAVPRCEKIKDFWGGKVLYFGARRLHSQNYYMCFGGYSLFPNYVGKSECGKGLKWVPEPPQCLKRARESVPENGYSLQKKYDLLHNESYQLSCRNGYVLYSDGYMEGIREMTITNINGTLVPNIPECREERCDPTEQSYALVKYTNGSDVTTKIISGTEVLLSCQQGYEFYDGETIMTSPLKRTCVKGKFERASFCQEERCDPTEQSHALLKYTNGSDVTTKIISGTEVLLSCRTGYKFYDGDKVKDSPLNRTCVKGKIEGAPICQEVIRCPYVPNPAHGKRIDANNGAGDFTEFTCDIGYKIKGRRKLQCGTDGNWLPSTPPICDPMLCPNLQNIRNGRLLQNTSDGIQNNYESVTEYTCDFGYYINAETDSTVYRRKCQADGTWSDSEPVCEVPKCEEINDFWGGQVAYFGDKKLYSAVYYTCDDDYTIYPKDVTYSECEKTLQWVPKKPHCLKKATKEVPKNGYSPERKTELLHNESYRVYCRLDYEFYSDGYMEGIHQMTITNNNGTLVPKLPECREARCDPIQQRNAFVQYKNGSYFTTKITSRAEVFLSCHKGYKYYNNGIEMESPLTRTCVKGKIERAPTCEEERCDPSEQNHATVKYKNGLNVTTKIFSRTEIFLACHDGYQYYNGDKVMKTPLKRTCVKGQIERAHTCEEERCDPTEHRHAIVKYTNGLDVSTKIISRTEVLLSCHNGYTFKNGIKEINSLTRRTCIKGIIEGAQECEEKKCEFSGYPSNQNTHHQSFHPGNSAKDIVVDGSSIDAGNKIEVSCKTDEEYELYVNTTETYLKTFTSECRYGKFHRKMNYFPICLEKRCDPSQQRNAFVQYKNGYYVTTKIISRTEVILSCHKGYKVYNGENEINSFKRTCIKGTIEDAPTCEEGKFTSK